MCADGCAALGHCCVSDARQIVNAPVATASRSRASAGRSAPFAGATDELEAADRLPAVIFHLPASLLASLWVRPNREAARMNRQRAGLRGREEAHPAW